MKTFHYYAGGKWHAPSTGEYFESDDPSTGKPWALIPRCDAVDVDRAVQAAHSAFTEGPWSRASATERGRIVRRIGDAVAKHADMLADAEVKDNGKKIGDIRPGLTSWLIDSFDYYAGLADKIEGSVIPVDVPGIFNYTKHEPFGVVGAITAWNSPLLIAIWKIAPALAAGNTMVIKPSEFASASTLALMEALEDADLPDGLLNVITGFGQEAGEPLVDHQLVRKVSFTGSVNGGHRVAEVAARQTKSITMELGGKSPQIVFSDALMDDAVNGVAAGIFPPAGQSCIAGSRLLVQADIHDAFVDKLITLTKDARVGDPRDPETHIGPIANKVHFDRVMRDIESAKAEGAACVLGGSSVNPDGSEGWYIEPTIFTNVTPDMRLAQDEIFGPVIAVIPFKDEEDAARIANDTIFGLAAGIWTTDYPRAMGLADRIGAGTIYINNYFNACTMSPVGGYKQSGYGRENGIEGMKDFLQTKSVWMSTTRGISNPFS